MKSLSFTYHLATTILQILALLLCVIIGKWLVANPVQYGIIAGLLITCSISTLYNWLFVRFTVTESCFGYIKRPGLKIWPREYTCDWDDVVLIKVSPFPKIKYLITAGDHSVCVPSNLPNYKHLVHELEVRCAEIIDFAGQNTKEISSDQELLLSEKTSEVVKQLLRAGLTVKAIRLVKEVTGLSLEQSKNFIDSQKASIKRID